MMALSAKDVIRSAAFMVELLFSGKIISRQEDCIDPDQFGIPQLQEHRKQNVSS
jgi:hypothetical protein